MKSANPFPSNTSLWETFYPNFVLDLSRITKDVNYEREVSIFNNLVLSYGEDTVTAFYPAIGKALETSLANSTEFVIPESVPKYSFFEDGLPKPLAGLWRRVFNRTLASTLDYRWYPRFDARDADDPAVQALSFPVLALRQYFLAFSKATDVECSADPSEELERFSARISTKRTINATPQLIRYCRNILGRIFCADHESLGGQWDDSDLCAPLAQWEEEPFGAHGPGAVAGGERGPSKWLFDSVKGVDDRLFSYYDPSFSAQIESEVHTNLSWLEFYSHDVSRTSAAVLVPKDFRGHRVICMEPKELQFAQQGLLRVLTSVIEGHYLSRRSIHFSSQIPSRIAARKIRNVTIDLKDASDTLGLDFVKQILPAKCFELLTRYRSNTVEVNGVIIPNEAFATMGSAICFPMETICFFAVALASAMIQDGYSISSLDYPDKMDRFIRRISLVVFGDDIVVNRDYASKIIDALEDCGMLINMSKTCLHGLAREACGAWYYAGSDVSIVRFKHLRLSSQSDWLATADQLREFGPYKWTTHAIATQLDALYKLPFSYLGFQTKMVEVNGRLTPCGKRNASYFRWNLSLQRLEVRMPCAVPAQRTRLDGEKGLYAYFTNQAIELATYKDDPKGVNYVWVAATPYARG